MKKVVVLSTLGLATMFVVSACGTNTASQPQPSTTPATPVANATTGQNTTTNQTGSNQASTQTAQPTNLTVKIVTGKMDGKPGWPQFQPANANLPANSVVNVTVKDYDDGAAAIPTGYNVVKGTVNGSITVDGKTVTSVPANDVAHTISIPTIGLNIPIPPKTDKEAYATVTFSFKTPANAEQLNWQCMAACGSGSSGWEGAMATGGWMKGVYNVQ